MWRGQSSGSLFRGHELTRLVAMIAFLGVLGLTYFRVKDPDMWRWMVRGDAEVLTVGAIAELDHTRKIPPGGSAQTTQVVAARQVEESTVAEGETKPDAKIEADAVSESPAPASAADETDYTDLLNPTESSETPAESENTTGKPPEPREELTPDSEADSTQSTDEPKPYKVRSASEYESSSQNQPSTPTTPSETPDAESPASERPKLTDLDPEEMEAAREEFHAITDKEFLRPEEMPLYWRMIGWQKRQTFEELEKRSRSDLTFTHLFDRPAEYRGQILKLKLRLVRSLSYEADENPLGVKRLYEAWGATDESYPEPYCIVMTGLPKDFPIGHDIEEEVTFCGYFFKVLAYRSRDDKLRASPLLVGQVLWHKRPVATNLGDTNWPWILLIGGAIVVLGVLRLGIAMMPGRPRVPRLPKLDDLDEDAVPIEDWLDQATGRTADEADPQKNGQGSSPDEGPNNGGPTPRLYNGDRFWRYEGRES